MKYIQKTLIGVLFLVLLLAAFFLVKTDREENTRKKQAITESERLLAPLEEERKELEKQLAENEENYYAKIEGIPHMILYFEDASPALYENAFPLLREYGYPAVFALEEENLIGTEGYLSKEQYDTLLAAGWQGLDAAELKRYKDHFRLEEIRMREEQSNVRIELEAAKSKRTSKIITVRYLGETAEDVSLDCSFEKYKKMLEWQKEQGEEVRVDTLYQFAVYKNDIVAHMEEYKVSMEETKQILEEKIAEINNQISNVDKNGRE